MRKIWLVVLLLLVSNLTYSQWVALDGDDYLVHRVWMYNDTVRVCETKVAEALYDYYQKVSDGAPNYVEALAEPAELPAGDFPWAARQFIRK